ncbi:class I SAM-dependent methyltransferase [bacterium]|nr:class I SAM-dependent methyltransferase [bacterium]
MRKPYILLYMLWFVGQFLDYKKVLKCRIKRPKILELGSGSGILSHILIDRYCGSATLIDASREAIDFAKEVSRKDHEIEYINKDIFNIHPKPEFDIVHSQGLFNIFKDSAKLIYSRDICSLRNPVAMS